ncbi:hypothetical protein Tco_1236384 [Tanacetum coccineum]
MVFSVASHKEEGSSSNPTPTIPIFDLPEKIVETIGDLTFKKRAKICYKTFLTILLNNHGLCVKGTYVLVNPSSRRCERKLRTLYADTRSLMARANGVDPDKILYYVMWNISVWNKDHSNAYKWIEANGQWLYDNFDQCEITYSTAGLAHLEQLNSGHNMMSGDVPLGVCELPNLLNFTFVEEEGLCGNLTSKGTQGLKVLITLKT